jgi:hypothetical protein
LVFGGFGWWICDFPELAEAALVVFIANDATFGVTAAEEEADGVEESLQLPNSVIQSGAY